jgi:hypothetical protein
MVPQFFNLSCIIKSLSWQWADIQSTEIKVAVVINGVKHRRRHVYLRRRKDRWRLWLFLLDNVFSKGLSHQHHLNEVFIINDLLLVVSWCGIILQLFNLAFSSFFFLLLWFIFLRGLAKCILGFFLKSEQPGTSFAHYFGKIGGGGLCICIIFHFLKQLLQHSLLCFLAFNLINLIQSVSIAFGIRLSFLLYFLAFTDSLLFLGLIVAID